MKEYKAAIRLTLLGAITFVLYLPALQNGFVNWDDDVYVYQNPNIKSIDFNFIRWVFSSVYFSNWHPLTMISYALDYYVWGLNPVGYHLTNILLHTINTLLVFTVVVRLASFPRNHPDSVSFRTSPDKTKDSIDPIIAAFATAFLFAIHPLRVESVVWISERKDVLCAFFFLLAILAYLRYRHSSKSEKPTFYTATLLLFTMALMSKPMAVSLPAVLLLIDFYPIKALRSSLIKGMVAEKLPFFLLSVSMSCITIWAQHTAKTLQPLETYSITVRVYTAAQGYLFYLCKTLFPVNLAPLYPHPPTGNLFAPEYIGYFLLLCAITIFCMKDKLLLTLWFYYIITLFPVIGIVQVGSQAVADRYTYLPSLAPLLLAGLGISAILKKCSRRLCRLIIAVSMVLLSGFLISNTLRQISVWHDSITLWSHEIKLFPDTAHIAYYNRGNYYFDSGRYKEAIADYTKAVEINPRYAKAYFNRGNTYYRLGDYQWAVNDYIKTTEIDPSHTKAYYNLGSAYSRLGHMEEAQICYKKAAALGLK